MFTLLFLIGAFGFLGMAFLSFGHHAGVKTHHASVSHGGHSLQTGHGHALPTKFSVKFSHATPTKIGWRDRLNPGSVFAISPLDVFVYCLGAGAVGLVLNGALAGAALTWAAIGGALGLNLLVFRPLMGLLLRFESTPSQGLEGKIGSEAEAACAFDKDGRGIVKLTLDGQLIQLLATLDGTELQENVTVHRGDTVVLLEVDPARNTCRVSRDLGATFNAAS